LLLFADGLQPSPLNRTAGTLWRVRKLSIALRAGIFNNPTCRLALSKNHLMHVFIPAYNEERFIGPAPRMKPNILLNDFESAVATRFVKTSCSSSRNHTVPFVGLRTVKIGLLAVTLLLLSDSNFQVESG
jgi:hypothetical protein